MDRQFVIKRPLACESFEASVHDCCATFRGKVEEPWEQKIARRAFATSEINCLETLDLTTNPEVVGSIPAGRATFSRAYEDAGLSVRGAA